MNTRLYIIGEDNSIIYILLHFRAKITLYYSIKISKIQCSKNMKKDCNVSKDGRVDSSPETPKSRAKMIKTNFWSLENSQTFITTKWTQNQERGNLNQQKRLMVFLLAFDLLISLAEFVVLKKASCILSVGPWSWA